MTALRPREDQITEITLIDGTAQPGGPHCAMSLMRTWHRAEGEGVETFKARVRADIQALGGGRVVWTSARTAETSTAKLTTCC